MVGFRSLLASAFLGFVVWFLLPLTSLHSDDCVVWLAVASHLWAGRFAIAFPAGGVSLAVRGPLGCPAAPRDGLIPRRHANGR